MEIHKPERNDWVSLPDREADMKICIMGSEVLYNKCGYNPANKAKRATKYVPPSHTSPEHSEVRPSEDIDYLYSPYPACPTAGLVNHFWGSQNNLVPSTKAPVSM